MRCVNENRKKRKRLRWQAANHGCHCFDRAFLLAGACVCCVKAFLAVFVYATHATQAIALEWKPGLRLYEDNRQPTLSRSVCVLQSLALTRSVFCNSLITRSAFRHNSFISFSVMLSISSNSYKIWWHHIHSEIISVWLLVTSMPIWTLLITVLCKLTNLHLFKLY